MQTENDDRHATANTQEPAAHTQQSHAADAPAAMVGIGECTLPTETMLRHYWLI